MGEDHSSDTSGETTTCDSGRGASDEEIVYPLTGKTLGEKSVSNLVINRTQKNESEFVFIV